MKRIYRVPLIGGVKNDNPLTGVADNPLCPIPIEELPGFDNLSLEDRGFTTVSLLHDVDGGWCDLEVEASDAFHEWLLNLMSELKAMSKEKGWKLDKTELEKTRLARLQGKE